jgi:hypothetical protein
VKLPHKRDGDISEKEWRGKMILPRKESSEKVREWTES